MSAALDIDGVSLRADGLIALRQIALKRSTEPVLAALPGGFAVKRKGNGQEVADVREYVAGDDIRHLDRGATARTGQLHVRQFQEERDRVTLLVADFRPCMFWGITRALRSVVAAEALCLIGWRVVEEGGRVGLLAITPDGSVIVPPRGRVRGMLDVVGGLVQAHASGMQALIQGETGDHPLDRALARAARLCPVGAEVIIASGFDAEGTALADELDALARRRTPQLLLITDADTQRLPKGRYPIRLADGRHTRVSLKGGARRDQTQVDQVAGRTPLVLDAGAPVEELSRRIATAFMAAESP